MSRKSNCCISLKLHWVKVNFILLGLIYIINAKISESETLRTRCNHLSAASFRELNRWILCSIEQTKATDAIREIQLKEITEMPDSKTVMDRALCSGRFVDKNLNYAIPKRYNGRALEEQSATTCYQRPLIEYQSDDVMSNAQLKEVSKIRNTTMRELQRLIIQMGTPKCVLHVCPSLCGESSPWAFLLDLIVAMNKPDTRRHSLESFSEDLRLYILKFQDSNLNTLTHLACKVNDTKTLGEITCLISQKTTLELLEARNRQECTPLHLAAKHGNIEAFRVIADSLTSDQLLTLLLVQAQGRTPLHLAHQTGNQSAIQLLEDYQTRCLIDRALQQKDSAGDYM